MRRMRLVWLSVVTVGLALAACGDGEDHADSPPAAPAFGEAQASTVVHVDLQNHRFGGMPAVIKGSKVFFKATNQGPADHELEVLDSTGKALGEIEAMHPGASGSLAVELKPGTYTVQCLVEEGGKPHAELGMKTTFTVP